MWLLVCSFSALVAVSWCGELEFPPGFKFGAATAAYQVEGAWNVSGRTESIWDRFTHSRPGAIVDDTNGDVACDSYHQWERDVQIAKELGLHFYRFSISWTRLLPDGYPHEINEDGKNYYNNLIDQLLRNGIEPVVTLYHWDLPQKFQDLGGWTNPLISDWFADYARVAYSLYADRVKTWITINEPVVVCDIAYTGIHAPGIVDVDIAPYICNRHLLLAHAKAWRIYDEMFRYKYHGQVSLATHLLWYEADTPEDEHLAELARELFVGRFAHPIFSKKGGWPPAIEKLIAENSKREGYASSRLPILTEEEIEFIRGTYDYFGFNHYTSRIIRKARAGESVYGWPFIGSKELGAVILGRPEWKAGYAFWFMVYPQGFRNQLAWVKKQYGDVGILITENGYATPGGLDDDDRIQYYKEYLRQVFLSIKVDAVNVTGYTAWTLIDNFEWSEGYQSKFGLFEVNFTDPLRKRTPRKSARFYASLIRNHSLTIDDSEYAEITRYLMVDSAVQSENYVNDKVYWGLYFLMIIIAVIFVIHSCDICGSKF